MNHKLYQLIQCADIVRFIKSSRLECLGHLRQMDGRRLALRIADWKQVGRIIRGRARKRWLDVVEDDLRCINMRG